MEKIIQSIENVCVILIVTGGINVFFPINLGMLDTETVAGISAAAIFAYALIIFLKKRNLFGLKSETF